MALALMPFAEAIAIFFISPMLTTVLSAIFLKEFLMHNAVDNRVAHIHVWACHINLGAQNGFTFRKLTFFHIIKEGQVFFNTGITMW